MNESRMLPEFQGGDDERLNALFRAYSVACEPRDVSPNFMPELWQKIEKVQGATFSFRRIARGFVTAAAGLSLVLASIAFLPSYHVSPIYSTTYVESLAAHADADAVDLIHLDNPEDVEEI